MPRRPLVVGNWKMELSYKATLETVTALKKLLKNIKVELDVVICPSFPMLAEVQVALGQSEKVALGAQNVHWEEKGAWTGEVSVTQIEPIVSWCIVGHSERRELTGETDQQVQAKANLLVQHGVTPIICIGETLAEYEADQTVSKITQQIEGLLASVTRMALTKLVIAYEPIWAISTNNPPAVPDPTNISQLILLIRKLVAERFDADAAERLRILYGGSVKPGNIQSFMAEPGIDGALIGSASTHPLDFVEIMKIVQQAHHERGN
ncbi:MAG: triose-phosphate isomerase [Candidatus Andersenbacteria bacterium]